ncbi:hypothetical protein GBAR_LOCUS2811 [Geodia barretti]|uniref:ORC1/DEAH AAA+ ATPase domain-containing protein n=1 Tax=Geodia barretti TaxID=519541 RepID=A0AA35R1N7_GEOBA|nr:hypothetical protein GBAR_LOCUS2811 [Geodia barretti]
MFSLRASRLLILQLRPAAFTTTKPIRGNTISSTLLKQVFFERLQRITLKEVNLVTGSIGSIATGLAVWTARKEYKRWFGTGLQDDLKKKILKSTYVINKKPSLYISRGGLPDIMNIFASKEKHKTVMVCGPRGSGKTAAVRETLKGQKRVVVVTLAGESQQLARAITESLGLNTNEQVNHTEVVVNALKEIRRNPGSLEHPPVLVVEVNERFTSPKALEELALTLKDWGHDEALVRPIVVLSTSRAAMGLEIGMDELRAEFASVGDLDREEAKRYIEQLCKEEGANNSTAVSKYAEQVVQILGSWLLHLDSFADQVRLFKNTSDQQQVSMKDVVQLASERETIELKDSRRALKPFHKRFPNTNKKYLYGIFKEPGAAVAVDEFIRMVGDDLPKVLNGLSNIQPHPFYVDPKTQTVGVGSVFVQKVIYTDHAN